MIKIQALRRHSWAGQAPVAFIQKRRNILRFQFAIGCIDHRSHYRAAHVIQEAVSTDCDGNQGPGIFNPTMKDRSHRGAGLSADRADRAKIMCSLKGSSCLTHHVQIQVLGVEADTMFLKRIADRRIPDAVDILFPYAGADGIEARQ